MGRVDEVAKKLGMEPIDHTRVKLSNGKTLQLVYFSPDFFLELIEDAIQRWPDPLPPMITVNGFEGETEQPNPHDPAYVAEANRVADARGNYITDAILLLGTECEVPDDWVRKMKHLNKTLPEDSDSLRLYYLKRFMLVRDDDMRTVVGALKRQTTITEEGIAEASARFPGNADGEADHSLSDSAVGDQNRSGVGTGRSRKGKGH